MGESFGNVSVAPDRLSYQGGRDVLASVLPGLESAPFARWRFGQASSIMYTRAIGATHGPWPVASEEAQAWRVESSR